MQEFLCSKIPSAVFETVWSDEVPGIPATVAEDEEPWTAPSLIQGGSVDFSAERERSCLSKPYSLGCIYFPSRTAEGCPTP